jgi:hypothetical protein
MRECPNCGAQISDQDVFCGECGARAPGGPAATIEADAAVTTAEPSGKALAGRKSPLLFVVIGGAAIWVVLIVCGALAFFFASRSSTTNETVSLGGSAAPTATRAPKISAPAWEPIFEETFDDNLRGWSEWEDEQGAKGVEDGGYYITVTETKWASWGTSEGLTFDDFVVEVEAQAVDGPDDNGYGLVFRYQDGDNFYYYEVSSDGYYSMGKMVADEWETLVGWTESDLIRLGRQTNTLRVECDGPRMTFFVNGYQIEEVTDYDFSAGALGFMAEARDEPGVRVHFDNLRVWASE